MEAVERDEPHEGEFSAEAVGDSRVRASGAAVSSRMTSAFCRRRVGGKSGVRPPMVAVATSRERGAERGRREGDGSCMRTSPIGRGATSCKTARSSPFRSSRGAGGGEMVRTRAIWVQRAGLPKPRATPCVCGSSTPEWSEPALTAPPDGVCAVEWAERRAIVAMSSTTWQQVHRRRALPSTKKADPTRRGGWPTVRAPTATTARCHAGTAPSARVAERSSERAALAARAARANAETPSASAAVESMAG